VSGGSWPGRNPEEQVVNSTVVLGRIPPLTDSTAAAVSRMVDDHAATERREPSHSQLESLIARAGLADYDPGRDRGRPIGKEKRIRLESDGDLRPVVLDYLEAVEARDTLRGYVRRIRQGSIDDALVIGTGKDLLEATAAHVVARTYGSYNASLNFPTLLGQAFVAVGLATPAGPTSSDESVVRDVERRLYELGCAVNRLRNREGTGHGRPFRGTVTPRDAKAAAAAMALVSEVLLDALGADS
jgi:hypothetical protein